ncbi:hypothetical protein Cma02nite_15670 [Cellulomonas marina]|nr:hypothetical protein Cma02nite_15670 [Cellulomonas marina]
MRPAGTVGDDESVLRASLPAPAPAPAPAPDPDEGHRPPRDALTPPRSSSGLPHSPDDSDVGWGAPDTADDERITRERPPHW